jgi:diguanylate cyclase (GGDEF)-like protein
MPFFDSTTKRFALRIGLPAILILLATFATVIVSLGKMAGEVNRIESTLTGRSATAAVQSILRRLGESHNDYAQWDDAVRNLYGRVNMSFVKENIVSSTATPVLFDTFYLIDENGNEILGYRNGEAVTVAPVEAFGSSLASMIADLPKDGVTYAVKTGLVRGAWGLAAIAVGPIVPVYADFQNPPQRSRYLVIGQAFDGPAVDRLSEDFVIDGLRLVAPTASEPLKVDLTDLNGTVIGALAWSPARLGSEAHARVSPTVLTMLLLVGMTMAFLIVFALRGWKEVQKRELQARQAATHDTLTGLPNRAAFVQSLDEAIARKRRTGTALAIVYLDLDGFKEVNDAYGHETGDELLRHIARGFRTFCGDSMLARVDGDEFAVLVSDAHATRVAPELGRRLIHYLAQPFDMEGRVIVVGTSVGIAIAEANDLSGEELLRRSDVAMYQAKRQGPNRVFVYHSSIDTVRHERLEIAADLRKAIQSNGLDLAYQAVFDAGTREIVAVEALLRWTRPVHGPLPSSLFVPIAEETGLIDELGAWMLRRACRDAVAWPGIRLSVNVSPAQLRNPSFEIIVSHILAETGFPVSRLELEVTESYFAAHPEHARKAIDAIRNLGVTVALDDFGNGYSSIGYLRNFNFSKVKLDRSLIAGIATDPRAQRLVQATIAVADALDLRVAADGVEIEEEAVILRLAGCREFQGFFFSRPCSAAEFAARLAAEKHPGEMSQRALSA